MASKPKHQFHLNPDICRTQYGALCWRLLKGQGQVQVLLITSRDTGRWVIPKGWPMPEYSPPGAASREAWEEAGVHGLVYDSCIGSFGYDKLLASGSAVPCVVTVYPLQVVRLAKRYPEMRERRRKWYAPQKAAKKVMEPDLKIILSGFAPPVPPEMPMEGHLL